MKIFVFIKKIFSLVIVFCFLFSMASFASADPVEGLNDAANQGFLGQSSTADPEGIMVSIPGAIGKIVGVVLSFVGVMFFLLMIYGGLLWMFARGNNQQVDKAKELIQAAVIGIIIVLSAYAITLFIGQSLTSSGTGTGMPRI